MNVRVLLATLLLALPLRAAELPPAAQKLTEAEDAQSRGWLVMSRKLLDEAAALDGEVAGLLFLRAMQEFREGAPRRAESFARAALRQRERVADAHTLLGLIALKDRDYAEAERQMRLALADDPSNGRGYYNLSEVLRWRGQPKEALDQLSIAIEKQPGNPILPLKLRLTRIESGDNTGYARPAQPDPAWTLTEAALALQAKNFDRAYALLEEARSALPAGFFYPLLAEDPFFQRFKDEPQLATFFSPPL